MFSNSLVQQVTIRREDHTPIQTNKPIKVEESREEDKKQTIELAIEQFLLWIEDK